MKKRRIKLKKIRKLTYTRRIRKKRKEREKKTRKKKKEKEKKTYLHVMLQFAPELSSAAISAQAQFPRALRVRCERVEPICRRSSLERRGTRKLGGTLKWCWRLLFHLFRSEKQEDRSLLSFYCKLSSYSSTLGDKEGKNSVFRSWTTIC